MKKFSNLSIFIMAGGGVHPSGNPWSRSLKSFQHKIVDLTSKNSKLSTWCQKIQNRPPDVKKFKMATWCQKIQNCPPDVKRFKIVHLMSKNSKLSTWFQKIQNYPPDVKKVNIVHLMSKNSKLSTWCSQYRDTRYPQPIKTSNMNCNTHALLAIRDDYNPSIHLVIQRQSVEMLVFVIQGICQKTFVTSSEGPGGIFQSECHISGCAIVNYGTYEKRQHKIFHKSKYTINYTLGSVTILPSGGQHHWVPSQQVEGKSL